MIVNPIIEFVKRFRRTALLQEGNEQSDGQLLDRFVTGQDAVALETLVRRHAPMVWGVCRRTLAHHAAEDAFQATFLVLVRKAASIRSRDQLANWLYGVAYRTVLKSRQTAAKRYSREKQVQTMPEPKTQPHEGPFRPEFGALMDQELSRLPEKYRIAIVLCDLEGKSHRDVAQQLRIKEGTVGSRLTRGRAILARRLTRHVVGVSATAVAAVLSQQAASGTVPDALLSNTIKATTILAAGHTVSAGLLSAGAVPLAERVLRTMMGSRLKILAAALLPVALITLGGVLVMQSLRQDGPPNGLFQARKDWPTKGQELMLLAGHTGPVLAVAIHPKGKMLVSAGVDGLRIWSLPGGQPLAGPARDTGPVNGLAFSPDGKLLAQACGNGVVKLLDVATMQQKSELKGHIGAVLTVAFHPNGGQLASGGADGTIKLWTVNGSESSITCKRPAWMRGPVRVVTFSGQPADLHPNFRGLPPMLAAAGGADKGRAGWLGL
jgi:RNA polymerase sigma factor (sigma-70 family)